MAPGDRKHTHKDIYDRLERLEISLKRLWEVFAKNVVHTKDGRREIRARLDKLEECTDRTIRATEAAFDEVDRQFDLLRSSARSMTEFRTGIEQRLKKLENEFKQQGDSQICKFCWGSGYYETTVGSFAICTSCDKSPSED